MVDIRGWIVVPCEFLDEDDLELLLEWQDVYDHIREITGRHIANISPIIQNGIVGISVFDFSNHAGEKLEKLRLVMDYLRELGPEVQASIVFSDYEAEVVETLEVGAPFSWM